MKFEGFSPETIDFLWGIRFNNNRDWFAANKEIYQRALYEPMKALANEVASAFEQTEGLKLHISRIYRDMRMHPSTFYKDSLWFCLRRDGGTWLSHPCLCFEVRPEGYRYGFLLAAPKSAEMDALRIKISDRADEFLAMVKKAEKESGIKLSADRYKRPKPCTNEKIAEFYAMKNLIAICDREPDELLFSEKLMPEVQKALLAWLPVHEFCRNL